MELPRYNHSLLSLTGSILQYFGVKDGHQSLPLLDKLLHRYSPKNVVLLTMDGMGTAALNQHLPPNSFLCRHLLTNLSSVFPPTTTAATTTLESGLSPAEHGWLGWSLYFPENKTPVDIFTNEHSYDPGNFSLITVKDTLLPYKTLYQRIAAAGQAQAYCLSPFSQKKCVTLGEIATALPPLLQGGKAYIYGYYAEPDYTMHQQGVTVPAVGAILRDIDRHCAILASTLQNTLLLITADHGHKDVQWRYLEDYPQLMALLEIPPTIEARALGLYVAKANRAAFATLFQAYFSPGFTLLSKAQVLAMGLLGPGKVHARLAALMGDFLAVGTGDYCIKYRRTPHTADFLGHHAGLSAQELTVPLICVPC